MGNDIYYKYKDLKKDIYGLYQIPDNIVIYLTQEQVNNIRTQLSEATRAQGKIKSSTFTNYVLVQNDTVRAQTGDLLEIDKYCKSDVESQTLGDLDMFPKLNDANKLAQTDINYSKEWEGIPHDRSFEYKLKKWLPARTGEEQGDIRCDLITKEDYNNIILGIYKSSGSVHNDWTYALTGEDSGRGIDQVLDIHDRRIDDPNVPLTVKGGVNVGDPDNASDRKKLSVFGETELQDGTTMGRLLDTYGEQHPMDYGHLIPDHGQYPKVYVNRGEDRFNAEDWDDTENIIQYWKYNTTEGSEGWEEVAKTDIPSDVSIVSVNILPKTPTENTYYSINTQIPYYGTGFGTIEAYKEIVSHTTVNADRGMIIEDGVGDNTDNTIVKRQDQDTRTNYFEPTGAPTHQTNGFGLSIHHDAAKIQGHTYIQDEGAANRFFKESNGDIYRLNVSHSGSNFEKVETPNIRTGRWFATDYIIVYYKYENNKWKQVNESDIPSQPTIELVDALPENPQQDIYYELKIQDNNDWQYRHYCMNKDGDIEPVVDRWYGHLYYEGQRKIHGQEGFLYYDGTFDYYFVKDGENRGFHRIIAYHDIPKEEIFRLDSDSDIDRVYYTLDENLKDKCIVYNFKGKYTSDQSETQNSTKEFPIYYVQDLHIDQDEDKYLDTLTYIAHIREIPKINQVYQINKSYTQPNELYSLVAAGSYNKNDCFYWDGTHYILINQPCSSYNPKQDYGSLTIGTRKSGEQNNDSIGRNSLEVGVLNEVTGNNAAAIGDQNKVEGNNAFAQGYKTEATRDGAHAEGNQTKAYGAYSHAEGTSTTAGDENDENIGTNAHAEGESTVASANNAHAEGKNTQALGEGSHAEGNKTIVNGIYSHIEGVGDVRNGFAIKWEDNASKYSEAQVISSLDKITATDTIYKLQNDTHANRVYYGISYGGTRTSTVDGIISHAEGYGQYVNGKYNHAEGQLNTIKGNLTTASHAEGSENTIKENTDYSHVEGELNIIGANLESVHVEGAGNMADRNYQHLSGVLSKTTHNVDEFHGNHDNDNDAKPVTFAIGGGFESTDIVHDRLNPAKKGNIFAVTEEGDTYISGHLEVDGTSDLSDRVTIGDSVADHGLALEVLKHSKFDQNVTIERDPIATINSLEKALDSQMEGSWDEEPLTDSKSLKVKGKSLFGDTLTIGKDNKTYYKYISNTWTVVQPPQDTSALVITIYGYNNLPTGAEIQNNAFYKVLEGTFWGNLDNNTQYSKFTGLNVHGEIKNERIPQNLYTSQNIQGKIVFNEFADKFWTNSSIATATATYRGSYNPVAYNPHKVEKITDNDIIAVLSDENQTTYEIIECGNHLPMKYAHQQIYVETDNKPIVYHLLNDWQVYTDIHPYEKIKYDEGYYKFSYNNENSSQALNPYNEDEVADWLNHHVTRYVDGQLGRVPLYRGEPVLPTAGEQKVYVIETFYTYDAAADDWKVTMADDVRDIEHIETTTYPHLFEINNPQDGDQYRVYVNYIARERNVWKELTSLAGQEIIYLGKDNYTLANLNENLTDIMKIEGQIYKHIIEQDPSTDEDDKTEYYFYSKYDNELKQISFIEAETDPTEEESGLIGCLYEYDSKYYQFIDFGWKLLDIEEVGLENTYEYKYWPHISINNFEDLPSERNLALTVNKVYWYIENEGTNTEKYYYKQWVNNVSNENDPIEPTTYWEWDSNESEFVEITESDIGNRDILIRTNALPTGTDAGEQIDEDVVYKLISGDWKEVSSTPDNNDYCYVQIEEPAAQLPYVLFADNKGSDEQQSSSSESTSIDLEEYIENEGTETDRVNIITHRYKFVQIIDPVTEEVLDATWRFEYQLNNTGFTQAQWDTINSGITGEWMDETRKLIQIETIRAIAAEQNLWTTLSREIHERIEADESITDHLFDHFVTLDNKEYEWNSETRSFEYKRTKDVEAISGLKSFQEDKISFSGTTFGTSDSNPYFSLPQNGTGGELALKYDVRTLASSLSEQLKEHFVVKDNQRPKAANTSEIRHAPYHYFIITEAIEGDPSSRQWVEINNPKDYFALDWTHIVENWWGKNPSDREDTSPTNYNLNTVYETYYWWEEVTDTDLQNIKNICNFTGGKIGFGKEANTNSLIYLQASPYSNGTYYLPEYYSQASTTPKILALKSDISDAIAPITTQLSSISSELDKYVLIGDPTDANGQSLGSQTITGYKIFSHNNGISFSANNNCQETTLCKGTNTGGIFTLPNQNTGGELALKKYVDDKVKNIQSSMACVEYTCNGYGTEYVAINYIDQDLNNGQHQLSGSTSILLTVNADITKRGARDAAIDLNSIIPGTVIETVRFQYTTSATTVKASGNEPYFDSTSNKIRWKQNVTGNKFLFISFEVKYEPTD